VANITGAQAPHSTFRLATRHGIWRVTLDGAFFGDYRSKQHALEGLEDARRALVGAGRDVEIVAPKGPRSAA
jgi:hypothetical protein